MTVVEALMHPGVQKLLEALRAQPGRSPELTSLALRNPELAKHVKLLLEVGLLAFKP
jgi:saccharopine dehydrogenase-like NADP-dependent oxidoreductase